MANIDFKVKNGLVVGTNATIGGGVETSDLRSKVGAPLSIFQYGDDGSGTNAAGIDVNQNSLVFFSKWTDNPNTEIRIEFNDSGNLILPNDTIIRDIGTGPADQAIKIGPTLRISNSTQNDTSTNGAIDGVDRLTLAANNFFTISILNTSQEVYSFYVDSTGLTFPDGTTQSTAWVGINLTTDSVSEGTTNLYYTDSRVATYLSSNGYATTALIDSAINALIDAAPDQLNTLNEIAVALNNDSNFAGTVTSLISTKVTEADVITLIDSAYINARVDAVSGVDSAAITTLIDSAYIQARQIIGGGTGTVDSAQTVALITNTVDSAYVSIRASNITNNIVNFAGITNYVFIADSAQTLFTGYDRDSNLLVLDSGLVSIFLNGIKLLPSDYSIVGNDLSLIEPAQLLDEIAVEVYTVGTSSSGGAGTVDSAQTVALITNTVDSAYVSARIGAANAGLTSFLFIADSGQTTFTGLDANGNTLQYIDSSIQVFLNGISLLPNDYQSTPLGNSLVLNDAAESGSQLLINSYGIISNSGTSTSSWIEITDSGSITAGSKNIVNTSVKPITLTLPASPSLGDEIKIIDGTGNAATNNITINMNGKNIEGITDNLLLDVNRSSITLLYYNTAQGWIISEK